MFVSFRRSFAGLRAGFQFKVQGVAKRKRGDEWLKWLKEATKKFCLRLGPGTILSEAEFYGQTIGNKHSEHELGQKYRAEKSP